jgi:phenylpropionate dioxygenase-like ring-hydroxylating dioxygenase large terminal subunit
MKPNYPQNCWYIVATDAEITDQPLSRRILGHAIALFRSADGHVSALEDRCAHRWAALSQGRVINDEIECPYHGFRYNSAGKCTHIPVQSAVPTKMHVRSYPVRQHSRWIWVWTGRPELAEAAPLPEIPWFTDPHFVQIRGYTELSCNYLLLQENVIDLTHLPYVHADAGQGGWSQRPSEVNVEEGRVTFTKTIEGEPISPAFGVMMGIEAGRPMNRTDWGTFATPACHYAGSDYDLSGVHSGDAGHFRIRTMHCVTPISPNRCHYWWAFAQDFALDQSMESIERFLQQVVAQDKRILEAIQLTIDAGGDAAPEVLISSDRAVVEARRILKRMLAAESPSGDERQ